MSSLSFTIQKDLCVLCLDAPREMMLLPCRHFCICDKCTKQPFAVGGRCPLCNENVTSVVGGAGKSGMKWLIDRAEQSRKSAEMFKAISENNPQQLRMLLQSGLSVNKPNVFTGDTPLIASVKSSAVDAVSCLLDHGADPQLKNRVGRNQTFTHTHTRTHAYTRHAYARTHR